MMNRSSLVMRCEMSCEFTEIAGTSEMINARSYSSVMNDRRGIHSEYPDEKYIGHNNEPAVGRGARASDNEIIRLLRVLKHDVLCRIFGIVGSESVGRTMSISEIVGKDSVIETISVVSQIVSEESVAETISMGSEIVGIGLGA